MLPDMPDIKMDHTQSAFVACGSSTLSVLSSNRQSCFTFSSGVWTESHSLMNQRSWHTSWASPFGIILMGGDDGIATVSDTTELLTANGVTQYLFQLKYALL